VEGDGGGGFGVGGRGGGGGGLGLVEGGGVMVDGWARDADCVSR